MGHVSQQATPTMPTERLFDGAVTLTKTRADWDGTRAELVTMQRGNLVQSELLTSSHVLFIGIEGRPHRSIVEVDSVPRWTGMKGEGASAFFAAGRRMRSWHSEGVGTELLLFFDGAAIEKLLHYEKPLHWQSRPSADDAFISLCGAEMASSMTACAGADDLAALRAETLATTLHYHVARRFSNIAQPRGDAGDAIGRAIDLIHATLPRAVSLEELVTISGVARMRLLANFRARTGYSPHQYIIRERLDRAKFLLSTTSKTLADVAEAVGCANPEHLGRMFRQHLRMSPRAWRHSHGQRR